MLGRIPNALWLALFVAVQVGFGGMVGWSSRHQPTERKEEKKTENTTQKHMPVSDSWLMRDAAGFFTLWLVIVGFGQAGLFVWQLGYMSKGLKDAAKAANAAKLAAEAAVDANRPWLNIKDVQFKEPLTITENGAFSMVTVQIKNIGRSPAIDASVWVEMLPMVSGEKVGDIQAHVVSEATKRNSKDLGNVVFPDQTVPKSIAFSIPMDQLVRGQQSIDSVDYVNLNMGVCTCYRIGKSPDIKHTCRIFLLGWARLDAAKTGVGDLNSRIGASDWDTAT
jgi:hypothetical protein